MWQREQCECEAEESGEKEDSWETEYRKEAVRATVGSGAEASRK